jgi:predicted metalloprotease
MLTPLLEQINRGESTTIEQRDLTAKELEEQAFIRTIVADNEDWTTIFKENNLNYRRPNIVLFSGGVETACGNATSDSGPFYSNRPKKCIWICLF